MNAIEEQSARAVAVLVPATSANLGPGFDSLGMALDLALDARIRAAESDRAIGLEDDPDMPPVAGNLCFRAADALYHAAGKVRPPLEIETRTAIPLSRGLGSSAAAVVAGLVGANALLGNPLGRDDLVGLATALEGHPDNVAPALLGGVTAAATRADGSVCVAPVPVHPALVAGLGLALVIPEYRLATAAARAVLPAMVPHRDATFNAGRAALLVAALASGRLDLLADALEDRLHQPFRSALVPGMAEAMAAGRDLGAYAVTISGAGPTLLAWCPRERRDAIGKGMAQAWAIGAVARNAEISLAGAAAQALI